MRMQHTRVTLLHHPVVRKDGAPKHQVSPVFIPFYQTVVTRIFSRGLLTFVLCQKSPSLLLRQQNMPPPQFLTYIRLFYIKENKGWNINSYTHSAITGTQPYPAWQLGTEQCLMSLKRLHALPSASWDPERRKRVLGVYKIVTNKSDQMLCL